MSYSDADNCRTLAEDAMPEPERCSVSKCGTGAEMTHCECGATVCEVHAKQYGGYVLCSGCATKERTAKRVFSTSVLHLMADLDSMDAGKIAEQIRKLCDELERWDSPMAMFRVTVTAPSVFSVEAKSFEEACEIGIDHARHRMRPEYILEPSADAELMTAQAVVKDAKGAAA